MCRMHAPASRVNAWRVEGGAALPCPTAGRLSPLAVPSRWRPERDGSQSYACPAPVHVEGAQERYAVTVRRREGKTHLGLGFREVGAELEVVKVVRLGLLAEWHDNCVADVAVVPGDVILGANGVEGPAAREVLQAMLPARRGADRRHSAAPRLELLSPKGTTNKKKYKLPINRTRGIILLLVVVVVVVIVVRVVRVGVVVVVVVVVVVAVVIGN